MNSTNDESPQSRKALGVVSATFVALLVTGFLSLVLVAPVVVMLDRVSGYDESDSRRALLVVVVVSAVLLTPVALWIFSRIYWKFVPREHDPLSCYLAVVDPNNPDADTASLMPATEWLCLGSRDHFVAWWPDWITATLEEKAFFDSGYLFVTPHEFERLQVSAANQLRRRHWFWQKKEDFALLMIQARQIESVIQRVRSKQRFLLLIYSTQEEVEFLCPAATRICDD